MEKPHFPLYRCAVMLLLLLQVGCALNPVTGRQEFVLMSEEQEIDVGRTMDPEIRKQYGVYEDGRLLEYVSGIGKALALQSHRPELFYHFTVLDSPVVNAFALPGGYVYITRGLLAHINNEAELAGVLAHEIGHVTARHAVRQYTKAVAYQTGAAVASVIAPRAAGNLGQLTDVVFAAIASGYSREYETQADQLAVRYTSRAGYDARAMADLLKTLRLLDRYREGEQRYTSLFATHPETSQRIEDVLEETLGVMQQPIGGAVKRDDFLRNIDGLSYGADIASGVLSGSLFRHPELRIALVFPDGWMVDNRPDAVQARDPGKQFVLELRLLRLVKQTRLASAAQQICRDLGLQSFEGNDVTIHGRPAYTGTGRGRVQGGGQVAVRAGFFQDAERLFYIIGYCAPELFAAADQHFNKTIKSVRMLSEEEAGGIKQQVVRLCRVQRDGETLAEILKRLGRPNAELQQVALLNAWDPQALPVLKKGLTLKVIGN